MTPEQTMQEINNKLDKMQIHRLAWFNKEGDLSYHDKEMTTLNNELQELYLRVESTPEEQIKLITAEAAGKEIEVLYKDQKEWKTKTEGRGDWDFRNFYRVKAGQEETEDTKPVPGEIVKLDFPAYIPPEPDSPEVKRRYAIVTPLILLMEKWAENEVDLQFKPKGDSEWSDVYGDPLWNFGDMDYQTVPKPSDTFNEVLPKSDEGVIQVELTKAQRDIERIAKAKNAVENAINMCESVIEVNPLTVMIRQELYISYLSLGNACGLVQKMIRQEKELGNDN